jgi:tetratricopeptide (TPR) repeat protein
MKHILPLMVLIVASLAATAPAQEHSPEPDELDTLLQQVQADAAGASEAQVMRLLELAEQEGRAYAASVAVKGYLSFHTRPSAKLLEAAARCAQRAGDYRGAITRYRLLLEEAPDNAASTRAAGRLYTLLVDELELPDEAYGTMRRYAGRFGKDPLGMRYDPWFLEQARQRHDPAAAAQCLAAALSRQMPLELERLHYWGHLDALLRDLTRATGDQFDAIEPLRAIIKHLRDDEPRRARAAFYLAHLDYHANAAGKDEQALAARFKPVIEAARAYFDAAPTLATTQDVYDVLYGGHGQWNGSRVEMHRAAMGRFLRHAMGKLPAEDRRAMMGWRDGLADEATWTQLGLSDPGFYKQAPESAQTPFAYRFDKLEDYTASAAFLDGVPSYRAAAVNALAAAAGKKDAEAAWRAVVDRLAERELWHLAFKQPRQLLRDELWRQFTALPIGQDAQEDLASAASLRFARRHVVNSPIALFDQEALRQYVVDAWRHAGDADPTRKAVIADLEALAWVPMDSNTRREVFGGAFDQFKKWADGIRQQVKQEKQVPQETIDAIAPIEAAFRAALKNEGDPSRAPGKLTEALARAVRARDGRDSRAFIDAGRQAYAQLKGEAYRKTPAGEATIRWLVAEHERIDSTPLQLDILADQLPRWSEGGDHRLVTAVLDAVTGARRHWSWGRIPKQERDRAQAVNRVLADALLAQMERGTFWPRLLGDFRMTRAGRGWKAHGWGEAVAKKIVEDKLFEKVRYYAHNTRSGTVATMALLRAEFPGLAKQYPVETWFDDRFIDEAKRTGYLDYRYWDYGRDEQGKVADAAADLLAGFDRLPLGYGRSDQPAYTLHELMDWHAKALGAKPAKRDAMLAALSRRYGKTRFDVYAMGRPWFDQKHDLSDEAVRGEYFKRLAQAIERAAAQPGRVGLPRLAALAGVEAQSLTGDELNILTAALPGAAPAHWSGGWGFEAYANLLQHGLRAQDRAGDLARIMPHLWAIARDTGNGGFTRDLVQHARRLARQDDPVAQELALVYATAGLEVMRGDLPEDARTALSTQRNQSLADVAAVIPVKRADPRYPVFAAQAAYLTGREQAAWDMVLEHESLLMTMVRDLDPGFSIWAVRRYTLTAGFDQAEELARRLLVWFEEAGGAFDPELRGGLMLAYADIALARNEHARARALFERIAAAAEYDGTLAQQRARLQVADVDRITGRFDDAIDALEKLSRSDDARLQPDAFCYLARVKFDQGRYREALEHLEKVFRRAPEHADARILEGKVRLAIKDIETVTEIPLGSVALQRQIVPGKPLKVSLEDPNLAVVGSAADIEIRAWTESGDQEHFSLLPFGSSKTKFRGQIDTVLGATAPGDGVLQVLGDDQVNYDFSERFKKANNISFGRPLALSVASDAELYASSGQILTREQIEQQKLESMIRQRLGDEVEDEPRQVALSTVRQGWQVKPGNPVNLRVVDPDRSRTAGVDELPVRLSARSGDVIGAFMLKETGPYTGVFEGSAPTTAGQPTAYASDSADGSEPNYTIAPPSENGGDRPAWSGLADDTRPKTFTIDLNDNVALGLMNLQANVPGQKIKAFDVQTSFNGEDFVTVGRFPEPYQPWDGSLRRDVFAAPSLPAEALNAQTLAEYLDNGRVSDAPRVFSQPVNDISGRLDEKTLMGVKPGGNGLVIVHFRGAFYQPRRQVRTLQVLDRNPDSGAVMLLRVDPGQEYKGRISATSFKASIDRGVHRVDLYVAMKADAAPGIELQWDIPDPPYRATVPAEAFSLAKSPQIRETIYTPPATVSAREDGGAFDIAFAEDARARIIRLVLRDFEGGAPAISRITLNDRAGQTVLPTEQDFLDLRRNQTLEITPGDQITVRYLDPVVNTAGKDRHEATLTATYANGTIDAAFVRYQPQPDGTRDERYVPMRRFKAGDVIHVVITDPDLDVSAEPDTVGFTAKRYDGEPVELEALETQAHSGVFVGKVFPVQTKPQRPGELRVSGNDEIALSYVDEANTDPGVSWPRTARVEQAWYSPPQLRVYELSSRELDEQELAAQLDAEAADAEAGLAAETVPVRRTLTAVRPQMQATGGEPTRAVLGGPLLVEVLFPYVAQSPESRLEVYAQAQSARDAAGVAAEAPFDLDVPGTIRLSTPPSGPGTRGSLPAGYRDLLVVGDPFAVDPLEDGRFTVNVPVEMGPTPVESFALPTPEAMRSAAGDQPEPLYVKGDDTVHVAFRFTDPQDQEHWLTASAKLTSDHFFDVMDRKYQEPVEGLYVGQSAYLRVIHPSRNASDQKDTIAVEVTTDSGTGRAIELTETFSHSGVFKGLVDLTYADDARDVTDPAALPVTYGDTVTLAYAPAGAPDQRIEHRFDVFKGADGHLMAFTKRFEDAEMAVQTQFTIAEAHFELAKRYRDLGRESEARRSIGQGKKLLEEAVRDHPDTKARAQADYLLANLSLEFAKDAKNPDLERQHYLEAINRFADIVASHPDSPYAPKAQYKKAQSYEKMGQIDRACEEYVKLSYRYPDHELVAETIARLGQYFLTKGKGLKAEADALLEDGQRVEAEKVRLQGLEMFKTAAEVFGRLAARFPNHQLADKTTVLSAQCYMQAERYDDAVTSFGKVIDNNAAEPELRAEAMYWAGDAYTRMGGQNNAMAKAYRMFKNLTWDFPETRWAKFARGRLTEETFENIAESGG